MDKQEVLKQLLSPIADNKDWLQILDNKLLETVAEALSKVTEPITPPLDLVFNFAKWTDLQDIKVIIIGQDPYPKAGDAHGLSFSTTATKIPQSLNNIYKCLQKSKLIEHLPTIGDLTAWAYQGVLLLNKSLTTIVTKSNEHKHIWNDYTNAIIKKINKYADENNKKYIWLLWGKEAKSLTYLIDSHHHIMEYTHPSPLAEAKIPLEQKFLNCQHFVKVNELLPTPINWNPYVKVHIFTDGSCTSNGTKTADSGYAVYKPQDFYPQVIIKGKPLQTEVQTNIRAEGFALYNAFKLIIKMPLVYSAVIYTDSKFWIEMFETHIPNWLQKSADYYKTKANPDMTMKLYKKLSAVKQYTNLKIEFIESHVSQITPTLKFGGKPILYQYNNKVDVLANEARSLKPGEIEIISDMKELN